MEAICAILNKHCTGTLYFGIDDKGFVRGQQITDPTKKGISRIISEAIDPKITPSIEVLKVDDRRIININAVMKSM